MAAFKGKVYIVMEPLLAVMTRHYYSCTPVPVGPFVLFININLALLNVSSHRLDLCISKPSIETM